MWLVQTRFLCKQSQKMNFDKPYGWSKKLTFLSAGQRLTEAKRWTHLNVAKQLWNEGPVGRDTIGRKKKKNSSKS